MRYPNAIMRTTAIAALLSVPLATGTVSAQETQSSGETNQTEDTDQKQGPVAQSGDSGSQVSQPATDADELDTGSAETGQTDTVQTDTDQAETGEMNPAQADPDQANAGQAGSDQAGSDQAGATDQEDALVATVGTVEIRGSKIMRAIGALPPQLQSQPPEMLVPMALDQLILRELILEEARGQNLASDPDVVALVESSSQGTEDDAMVQIWLERELADVVTDESVQQAYDQAQAQGQQDLPPMEEVRPQIEQHLRQQALQEIQTRLRQDADVVFYDPTGRPVEQSQSGAEPGQSDQSAGDAANDNSAAGTDSAVETDPAANATGGTDPSVGTDPAVGTDDAGTTGATDAEPGDTGSSGSPDDPTAGN